MDDELNLLDDGWDTAFTKTKITTFSTTKDTTLEKNAASDDESDNESESDGQNEIVNEADENAQFMLEEVMFDFDRTFTQVTAINGTLMLVTDSNTVIIYDEEAYREFEVEPKGDEMIHRVFIDPTCSHVLISMNNGDNYYFNTHNTKQPKIVPKMRGIIVESVGWNKELGDKDSTGTILIGSDSCLYEAKLQIKEGCKHFKVVYDFKDNEFLVSVGSITGIEVEKFPQTKNNNMTHYLVMVATSFRLYEFIGGPNFEELFESYKGANILTYKELPYTTKRANLNSELHFFKKSNDKLAESFAWLSNAGIYHGNLTFQHRNVGDSALKDCEIIQFDNKTANALSIAITEFHTFVVFPERLIVVMQPPGLCSSKYVENQTEPSQVSISSIKIVYQDVFSPSKGNLLGLTKDPVTGDIYIYTDTSIFKILVEDEERDVWRLYLEQALDPTTSKEQYFDMALRLCKHDYKTKDIVLTAKADFYIKVDRYIEAADIYARTSKMFEDVAIMLHNKNQKDALRVYLQNKLKLITANVKVENQNLTQLTCLCTWLTEMYLDKLNQLFDEGDESKSKFEKLQTEFRDFLDENKKYLNKDTTFRLISSHGQVQEAIYYAMRIEDYERVISHCITERDFAQALEILNKFCKARIYEEYFYKFAPVLMQHLPREMVNTLISKRFLEPSRLIPALMRYITTFNPKTNEENHVLRYLEWCIKKQENEDTAIHNLILSLYANLDDDTKLLQFLNTEGENNFYDPKYALRICTERGKTEACVRLYSMMGLYEDAVELSINTNEIKLARECADKPSDDELKKKLWLRISRHVIGKDNNVKKAIEFLRYTDKIKLEDILPFFPDFVLIDDFKEEICKSLEEYKNEIEELKRDMHDATMNANLIRDDIKELKHRYGYIMANAKCDSARCYKSILAKDFYLFPCHHVLHASCLIEEVLKHVNEVKRKKILELNQKRKNAAKVSQNSTTASFLNDVASVVAGTLDVQQTVQEDLKELDELISSECPYCGNIMISSIDEPFVEDKNEMESWLVGTVYDD